MVRSGGVKECSMSYARAWRLMLAGAVPASALLGFSCAAREGGVCIHDAAWKLEHLKGHAEEEWGPFPQYAGFFGNLDFEAGDEQEGDEY